MQFAFLKVKDPNTSLPKNVLIAWCGGGVPERTKGYFTSHLNAVAKVLHGYHVQITARSDADLEPAAMMQKVADASGAKYSSGSGGGASAGGPPPIIKSKPVFTPTSSGAGRSINPLVAARSQRGGNVDADGWGDDAPPVTRTTVEKVQSAYQPTKVNMNQLTSQKQEPSRFSAPASDDRPEVVRGAYQPVGKVDIAAIRAAAKEKGDDRPATVKGAYEPVGKVDIAAIRAKAKASPGEQASPAPRQEEQEPEEAPRPLADRAAAFSQPSQSERLTSLPKPKVSNQFGGSSSFTGTKAPVPGGLGFGQPVAASATANMATASRTFADQGGKTPAQIWAEKKAKERGGASAPTPSEPTANPVVPQTSGGGWQSGYKGKSWAPVTTSGQFGRPDGGQLSAENTGEATREVSREVEAEPASESGGVSALRDRFKNAAPMGSSAPPVPRGGFEQEEEAEEEEHHASPPPVPDTSRPSGGFALPGLPSRPAVPVEEQEEEEEEEDTRGYEREESPPRVAVPVPRAPEVEDPPAPAPRPPPPAPVEEEEEEEEPPHIPTRAPMPEPAFEQQPHVEAPHAEGGGKRAVIQFDYEKAEGNEIDLVEGEYVTDIEMVAEDWWMGTNSRGEVGLFPSNYVELEEDDHHEAARQAPPSPPAIHEPEPVPVAAPASSGNGRTATALYDYEAAEDNGKF